MVPRGPEGESRVESKVQRSASFPSFSKLPRSENKRVGVLTKIALDDVGESYSSLGVDLNECRKKREREKKKEMIDELHVPRFPFSFQPSRLLLLRFERVKVYLPGEPELFVRSPL